MEQSDLEQGVQMVMRLGLSTGHANTWLELLEEVLDQYVVCRGKLFEYKLLEEESGMPLEVFVRAKF